MSSSVICVLIGVFLSTTGVNAFTHNLKPITAVSFRTATSAPSLNLHPSLLVSEAADGAVSDAVAASTAKAAEAVMDIGAALPEAGGGIMDTVKNIAAAITIVLFLGAGLTAITAAIIVPGKLDCTF